MPSIGDPRFVYYVRELFALEDEVLVAVARRAVETGVARMEVTSEVGKLLHLLARAIGARRILEIGTLYGYSAIWMARALPPNGRLVTIELHPGRCAEAQQFVARAGLADVIEIRCGPALEVLPAIAREGAAGAPELYDLAFLDGAKEEYPAYLDWALQVVRPGGLIVADNTLLSSGGAVVDDVLTSSSIAAVRAFNQRIASDPRLTSTILPVREGISISVVG